MRTQCSRRTLMYTGTAWWLSLYLLYIHNKEICKYIQLLACVYMDTLWLSTSLTTGMFENVYQNCLQLPDEKAYSIIFNDNKIIIHYLKCNSLLAIVYS